MNHVAPSGINFEPGAKQPSSLAAFGGKPHASIPRNLCDAAGPPPRSFWKNPPRRPAAASPLPSYPARGDLRVGRLAFRVPPLISRAAPGAFRGKQLLFRVPRLVSRVQRGRLIFPCRRLRRQPPLSVKTVQNKQHTNKTNMKQQTINLQTHPNL